MHHPEDDTISNPSSNESFESILERNLSRRQILKGGLGAAAVAMFGPSLFDMNKALAGTDSAGLIGFTGISPSTADTVRVPAGYSVKVLYAWGDPVSVGPAFLQDASNSAADQAVQAGMHHDGMHFFPFPKHGAGHSGQYSSDHGLLCVNHEYTDDGLLHPDGMMTWTAEKVSKSKAAHGVSVI
ncbi:MAG: PhoX family protein, partial [Gammaproteobacteria bacterium]